MTFTRRSVLATGAAALAGATAPRAFAAWAPSESYPDPAIEVLYRKFERYRIFSAGVERLATDMRWCEGPVWFGDGRYLLWSDIPNNRIMKWEEATGRVSVFREPANYTNGHCRDRQCRLISCAAGVRSPANFAASRGSHSDAGVCCACTAESGSACGRFTNQIAEVSSKTW